jgi:formamidopyrimidine-DNA glycosylase
LFVLIAAHGGGIFAPGLDLEVTLGQDLGAEREELLAVSLERGGLHGQSLTDHMPELPEVEVAARNLRRWMTGRKIRGVEPREGSARIFRPAKSAAIEEALTGTRFQDVRRVGKNLLITLESRSGPIGLWSHLGLTGKWLRRASDAGGSEPPFARLSLELDDRTWLYYADTRIFGRLRLVPAAAFDELGEIAALGPDPLNDGIDAHALHARLAKISKPIKVAIMDQALLPGIGNIQAIEGLYRAGIDPRRPAKSLSQAEVNHLRQGLLDSIAFTLSTFDQAGSDGGDADISYVEERRASNPFLIYGRAGEPCPRCGKNQTPGTITRIVQAQRATYFCPSCQK